MRGDAAAAAYAATVPGDIHHDLVAAGALPDPNIGDNAKHLRAIGFVCLEDDVKKDMTQCKLPGIHVPERLTHAWARETVDADGKDVSLDPHTLNVYGMLYAMHAEIKHWLDTGTRGAIVNVGSLCGEHAGICGAMSRRAAVGGYERSCVR